MAFPVFANDVTYGLRTTDIRKLIVRTGEVPPLSPLDEYARAMRGDYNGYTSPAISHASEESLDCMLMLSASINQNENMLPTSSLTLEEMQTNELIYRLCRSLYKKARQKTELRQKERQVPAVPIAVAVDGMHEKNMSHVVDWMPLLHLFEPKAFYAYQASLGSPDTAPRLNASLMEVVNNPQEASIKLLDALSVEKLSGGNSNHVYRIGHPNFPDKSILLRVYGSGSDEIIDRYRDIAAMKQMSRAGLSPCVLHSFKWGRVEEFMENVATCSTDMLLASPTLLSIVYKGLHEMHQLSPSPFYSETINKVRFGSVCSISADGDAFATPDEYCSRYVDRLETFLSQLKHTDYYCADTHLKAMEDVCHTSLERVTLRLLRLSAPVMHHEVREAIVHYVCDEIMVLRSILQRRAIPIVFSHNDLNPGNILLSQRLVPPTFRTTPVDVSDDDEVMPVVSDRSTPLGTKYLTKKGKHRNLVDLKGLVFIDFEYSDVNYRCYDLGNTICELDYDYSRGVEADGPGFIKYFYVFPPDEYKSAWCDLPMEYPRMPQLLYDVWLQQQDGVCNELESATGSVNIGLSCLNAVRSYFAEKPSTQPLTREELTEVFLGMLSSHLQWALWSFVMGCNPDECTNNILEGDGFAKGSSGLDYLYYGSCRLLEYIALKEWLSANSFL